ncbi:hypothetical protein TWF730_005302 [Orbilia blumenaviensis]|uniref:Uncharacterized protein n=1 Tax=Orbilia blumenaviensis TaxID=1796055 RepID=A0AAV9VHZ4_9PEZI
MKPDLREMVLVAHGFNPYPNLVGFADPPWMLKLNEAPVYINKKIGIFKRGPVGTDDPDADDPDADDSDADDPTDDPTDGITGIGDPADDLAGIEDPTGTDDPTVTADDSTNTRGWHVGPTNTNPPAKPDGPWPRADRKAKHGDDMSGLDVVAYTPASVDKTIISQPPGVFYKDMGRTSYADPQSGYGAVVYVMGTGLELNHPVRD